MSSQPEYELPGTPALPIDDPMVIGRIARPVGVRGEVKVSKIANGSPRSLQALGEYVLIQIDGQFRTLHIIHKSPTGDWIRFKIEGVETPEHAALLQGAEIIIPAAERPSKDQDEYYVDDLIGCNVLSEDDLELGFIQEVWHQPHHDIWVVDGMMGEILIPARKEFVLSVDLKNHQIVVKRVEGLWEES